MKRIIIWALALIMTAGPLPGLNAATASDEPPGGVHTQDAPYLVYDSIEDLGDYTESSGFLPFFSAPPWNPSEYVLESRHIIFRGDPATYLAPYVSPAAFSHWLAQLDTVYELYVDLIGTAPAGGQKMVATIAGPNEHWPGAAWAWVGTNQIGIAPGWWYPGDMTAIENTGTVGFLMPHEMGHCFDMGPWNFHDEFTANLKILYAMEKDGSIEIIHDGIVRNGSYYRDLWYNNAVAFYHAGTLEAEIKNNNDNWQFYFSPIIENAGWDIFEAAFRSYFDDSYSAQYNYTGPINAAKLAEFLDRLTYFNGGVDVLSYSLDGGDILRKIHPITRTVVHVTGVTLSKNAIFFTRGMSGTLTAEVTPWNATKKAVTWHSGDETVATVDSKGCVTAIAEGTAAITVTTADGGFTAQCLVTVNTDILIPSVTDGTATINLTKETFHLGFTPKKISVTSKPGKPDKWGPYFESKHNLSKLLDKGWASLKIGNETGSIMVEFPAVEKRGKTGGGLGNIKLGIWYPADAPAAWVLADKSKFKSGSVTAVYEGLEICTYGANKKPANDWAPVDAEGITIKQMVNNKVVKTPYAVREAAKIGDDTYHPATKPIKVSASSYGKPTKLQFKAGKPPTLKLKAGTMYIIGDNAAAGPAAAGEKDFAGNAGSSIAFWMAPTGKKPATTPQAAVTVPG